MLGLAVAAVIGALFGPFSVVVPVVAHGLLWLAGVRASADDSDARALRTMQLHLGAVELVAVWLCVAFAGHWIAPDGHYLAAGGLVAVIASATAVALVDATRVVNNALVALVPAAAAAGVAGAIAARFVL